MWQEKRSWEHCGIALSIMQLGCAQTLSSVSLRPWSMTASAQTAGAAEHGHDSTGLKGTGSATFWFSGFFLHQHLSGLSGKKIQEPPGIQ